LLLLVQAAAASASAATPAPPRTTRRQIHDRDPACRTRADAIADPPNELGELAWPAHLVALSSRQWVDRGGPVNIDIRMKTILLRI
jgi:hypothetical protein